jgi:hypothetical protein
MTKTQTHADRTSQPDPNRAGTGMATPAEVGRLLSLVRRLIEYGQTLVLTLQQRPLGPGFVDIAAGFGTLDVAVIIARIVCGLRRAVALEDRLRKRAASGRDFALAPVPSPSATPGKPGKPRKPRAQQPPPRQHAPAPDGLPTVAQLAAEIRHRPVGAVFEDICHELGILPGDIDRPLWDEIFHAITYFGGNLARFIRIMMLERLCPSSELLANSADPTAHLGAISPLPDTLAHTKAHPTGPSTGPP